MLDDLAATVENLRPLLQALAHPIEPITPWVEQHDGEAFITIPDNLGYPVTRERLEGLWRG